MFAYSEYDRRFESNIFESSSNFICLCITQYSFASPWLSVKTVNYFDNFSVIFIVLLFFSIIYSVKYISFWIESIVCCSYAVYSVMYLNSFLVVVSEIKRDFENKIL